jgi:hypothetical protein
LRRAPRGSGLARASVDRVLRQAGHVRSRSISGLFHAKARRREEDGAKRFGQRLPPFADVIETAFGRQAASLRVLRAFA